MSFSSGHLRPDLQHPLLLHQEMLGRRYFILPSCVDVTEQQILWAGNDLLLQLTKIKSIQFRVWSADLLLHLRYSYGGLPSFHIKEVNVVPLSFNWFNVLRWEKHSEGPRTER